MVSRAWPWRGQVCSLAPLWGAPPTSGTGNRDPLGCPGFFGLATYQQVYSSAAFAGAMDIDGLTFFQSQVAGNGGQPAGGTYTLSLSYTAYVPHDPSLAGANADIDLGSQAFFTGALPARTAGSRGNLLPLAALLRVQSGGRRPVAHGDGYRRPEPRPFSPPGPVPVRSAYGLARRTRPWFRAAHIWRQQWRLVSRGNDVGGWSRSLRKVRFLTLPLPEPGPLLLVLEGIGLIGYQRCRRSSSSRICFGAARCANGRPPPVRGHAIGGARFLAAKPAGLARDQALAAKPQNQYRGCGWRCNLRCAGGTGLNQVN